MRMNIAKIETSWISYFLNNAINLWSLLELICSPHKTHPKEKVVSEQGIAAP